FSFFFHNLCQSTSSADDSLLFLCDPLWLISPRLQPRKSSMSMRRFIGLVGGLFLSLPLCGCGQGASRGGDAGTVVVYSALDEEFAEPVLRAYGARAGVRVLAKFDVESTKTVGLTNLLMTEAAHP